MVGCGRCRTQQNLPGRPDVAVMPAPRRGTGRPAGLTTPVVATIREEALRAATLELRGTIVPAQLPAGARRTGLNPRCQAPMPNSEMLNKTLTPERRFPCFTMCPLSRHPKPASKGAGEGPGSLGSLALHTPSCPESRSGGPRLCMCAWWGLRVRGGAVCVSW